MAAIHATATIGKGGTIHLEGLPLSEGTAVSIEVLPQVSNHGLTPPRTRASLEDFIGTLTLTEDPLEYQRRFREEWDGR